MKEKKRFGRRLLLAGLLVFLGLGAAFPAQAAQKVITGKIASGKIKKITNSNKNYECLQVETTEHSAAIVKGNPAEDRWNVPDAQLLCVTVNGKSERVINLKRKVKSALKLSSKDKIVFYQLTHFGSTFYMAGAYFTNKDGTTGASEFEGGTAFYLSTMDGRSVKVVKLPSSPMKMWRCVINSSDGWGLYKCRNQYVAVANCIPGTNEKNEYVFLTSQNLKTWTTRKVTPSKTSRNLEEKMGGSLHLHLSHVTSNAVFFNEEVNGGPNGDYTGFDTVNLVYTTNFKSLKEVSDVNKTIKTNGNSLPTADNKTAAYTHYGPGLAVGKNSVVFLYEGKEYRDGTWFITGCRIFAGDANQSFKQVYSRKGGLDRYGFIWDGDDGGMRTAFIIDEGTKHDMVVVNASGKSASGFRTNYSAQKWSGSAWHDGWVFTLYDGRYLLATKNHHKTLYKIDTGKKNIKKVAVVNDSLVLVGSKEADYYIPLSVIENVLK